VIPPNENNRFYLETKAIKSGHLFDLDGKVRPREQMDHPIVDGMTPDAIDLLEEYADGPA
jgi:GTP cyclohydrolase II